MTGAPGISPAINSPPEVCASASNSGSSSPTLRQVDVRRHPVEVSPRAPAEVAGRQRLPGAIQIGHRRRVDHRRDAAGARQFVQVSEQAETRYIRCTFDARRQRRPGRLGVEGGHHGDRLIEALPGGLVPVVQHADPQRLGQRQRRAWFPGVVAQQRFGSAVPVTASPYLGSGSSTLCPPAR